MTWNIVLNFFFFFFSSPRVVWTGAEVEVTTWKDFAELSQLLGKEVFWKDEVCCIGQFKEVAIPGKYLLVGFMVLNILKL